jgi:hypothetical protein
MRGAFAKVSGDRQEFFRIRRNVQVRWEVDNLFNHTPFNGADTTARFAATGEQVNPTFGQVTSTRSARVQAAFGSCFERGSSGGLHRQKASQEEGRGRGWRAPWILILHSELLARGASSLSTVDEGL